MPATPLTAGNIVDVRRNRWIVEETVAFPDCTLLKLTTVDSATTVRDCKLLLPFDRPTLRKMPRRARAVSPRRWWHLLQSHLNERREFGQLRAAAQAAIDLLPFQLEPALAVARGLASRLLLADEVGLGKTIQAGLVLAELRHRGWCDRALILTPAGLREQWSDELSSRFGIRAAIFDADSVRAKTAVLPLDMNLWMVEPVVIASMDFIKQPEVLRAAASILWDLVIIDEAHQAATAPQRLSAAQTLAEHARHVALITATPHAGDEAAYAALCAIGRLEARDPIALFRRTRRDIGLSRRRRIHLFAVRLTDDEKHMHRLLTKYTSRAWRAGATPDNAYAQLVAMTFRKRAFSGASALALSIARMLTLLDGRIPSPLQGGLPFGADDDAADLEPALAEPIFEKPEEEQTVLEELLAAAERALKGERKVAVLCRLLKRIAEPAIVFTEYRDTLLALEPAVTLLRRTSVLHGGLTRTQRRAAVEEFNTGAAGVLLTTDAGSEGLNLQSRCRLVINLELPWNPIRLEQRIGRVDRLGQPRTVHAISLFASETAESFVLARLVRRIHQIRRSVPSFDSPVFLRTEADVASEIFNDAHAGSTG